MHDTMFRCPHLLRPMRAGQRIVQILLFLLLAAGQAHGQVPQEEIPPELRGPLESTIQEMRFEKPTRITARLLILDPYENAIWVEWISRFDDGGWSAVPGHRQFKVLPRDPAMMEYFRTLKPGTSLTMTVQVDGDGNRRVVALGEGI